MVVATEADAAARLLPGIATLPRRWKSTRMLAFAAGRSPLGRPILVVGSGEQGVIDNLVVPSDVAAGYAPAGESLVTVTVRPGCTLGDADAMYDLAHDATDAGDDAASRRWYGLAVDRESGAEWPVERGVRYCLT